MKRFKKVLITLIITLSLTITPDFASTPLAFTALHISSPTITYVQAKTKYVLITRTGTKYHCRKCGNGTYFKCTLKKAKAQGLTPCKKCFG